MSQANQEEVGLPLKLDCYDEEEGNTYEHGREGDNDEQATSETGESPITEEESTLSRHDSPITLGVNSSSAEPLTRSQISAADMQLSGLDETPVTQSADHPSHE